MTLRFFAVVWSIGVLATGCHSQGGGEAALSLEEEAIEAKRALYEGVALIAGSGAEEDEPIEEDASQAAEPAEADAGVDERILEEQGWADDSAQCGNGVLDEGELCDYGILEGEGVCPEECSPAPGCPDETLVVHGCMTRCVQNEAPSEGCPAAQ